VPGLAPAAAERQVLDLALGSALLRALSSSRSGTLDRRAREKEAFRPQGQRAASKDSDGRAHPETFVHHKLCQRDATRFREVRVRDLGAGMARRTTASSFRRSVHDTTRIEQFLRSVV
jgi:hypothetical protein